MMLKSWNMLIQSTRLEQESLVQILSLGMQTLTTGTEKLSISATKSLENFVANTIFKSLALRQMTFVQVVKNPLECHRAYRPYSNSFR